MNKAKAINIVKCVLITLIIGVMYAFISVRNSNRGVVKIYVDIKKNNYPMITSEEIKTILESNIKTKKNLSLLEDILESNSFIQNAEVYKSVDGKLFAEIHQRLPILRIQKNQAFYIDTMGVKMNVSKVFSPRVPIYYGELEKENLGQVYYLAKCIYKDDFMTKHIVSIWKDIKIGYQAKIRHYDFDLQLGKDLSDCTEKFRKFKAFYQRALKEQKLNTYKEIDLRIKRQVICRSKKIKKS